MIETDEAQGSAPAVASLAAEGYADRAETDVKTMASNLRKPSLYDDDFFRWTNEQADLLRQGRFADVDLENIVEEIETLGRSEQRELESAYRLIAMHLLKSIIQPERISRSWLNTIVRERNTAERTLETSPSLKAKRDALFALAYRQARKEAASETGFPLVSLPEEPPFTREELEDEAFLPPALVEAFPETVKERGQS